jgi:hypothetical protein
VLDVLLAGLHLECVVRAVLQPANGRYAMHMAAEAGAVTQLRVLQMLGADLDLPSLDSQTKLSITPLIAACCVLPGHPGHGSICWNHQQQQQQQREVLMEQGDYKELVQRRLEVVQLLVGAGALVNHTQQAGSNMVSALSAASFAGLYWVVEYLLPHAKAAAGDESRLGLGDRVLFMPIYQASAGGSGRCLRLLIAAGGGPGVEEARMVLFMHTGILTIDAMKLLLDNGVPVNAPLKGRALVHAVPVMGGKQSEVSTCPEQPGVMETGVGKAVVS